MPTYSPRNIPKKMPSAEPHHSLLNSLSVDQFLVFQSSITLNFIEYFRYLEQIPYGSLKSIQNHPLNSVLLTLALFDKALTFGNPDDNISQILHFLEKRGIQLPLSLDLYYDQNTLKKATRINFQKRGWMISMLKVQSLVISQSV